ncbi:MAG: TIGR01459 family HAD-type hydrolase [Methylobacteriaceae bacterium]|nr:TIGR01459 family HAD-type hydrolase [Methylobacteriaceae bacterium]
MNEFVLDHRVIEGLRDVADDYDVILCDVWGVVHNGVRAFRRATEALASFRARGGATVLITNAPRPARPIIRQLDDFGVPRSAYDAVVTSGDVTLALMHERAGAPVHHIGPSRDLALFDELHTAALAPPARVPLDAAAYVVCTGLFDDEAETPEDYEALLEEMGSRGLAMICANPDLVVHRGEQLLHCAGALAARFEEKGGVVIYAGKPHAPIYEKALDEAALLRGGPVARSRVLAIGDAMRTDIAGAAAFGIDALFVTRGIHREELHGEDGSLDPRRYGVFAAKVRHRPVAAISELVW